MDKCNSQLSDRARKTRKILNAIDEAYQSLKKYEKTSNDNFIQGIPFNFEQGKFSHIIDNLAQKYLVMKHSYTTKQPQPKYLYISDDRRYLCWKSPHKEDEKIIQLNKIERIIKDKELTSQQRNNTIASNSKNLFIIKSDTRNLKIQCQNEVQAEKIVFELQQAIKNSRRMPLNCQF